MSHAVNGCRVSKAHLMGGLLALLMVCGGANAEPSSKAERSTDEVSSLGLAGHLRLHAGWAYNHYREPTLDVTFAGPEVVGGVLWLGEPDWVLSSELKLGQQHYDSPGSGSRTGIPNVDWQAQGLYALERWAPMWRGVHSGLAVQVIYTDFSGATSLGKSGYVRESRRVWWPLRWTQPLSRLGLDQPGSLEVEVAMLLYGEHVSRLSQVGGTWQDAINRQRSGISLQLKRVGTGQGLRLEPYARVTRMGTSDTVGAGAAHTATEPRNVRVQLGLNWSW